MCQDLGERSVPEPGDRRTALGARAASGAQAIAHDPVSEALHQRGPATVAKRVLVLPYLTGQIPSVDIPQSGLLERFRGSSSVT